MKSLKPKIFCDCRWVMGVPAERGWAMRLAAGWRLPPLLHSLPYCPATCAYVINGVWFWVWVWVFWPLARTGWKRNCDLLIALLVICILQMEEWREYNIESSSRVKSNVRKIESTHEPMLLSSDNPRTYHIRVSKIQFGQPPPGVLFILLSVFLRQVRCNCEAVIDMAG